MTENTAARKPRSAPATRTRVRKPPVTTKKTPPPAKPAADQPKPTKKAKKEKQDKSKVVRDSFTMPQADYDKIAELKQVCRKAGLQVKKSELLRAGLLELSKLSIPQLERTIVQLTPIKTGRPKKG